MIFINLINGNKCNEQVLERMIKSKVRPNVVTFNSLLNGYTKKTSARTERVTQKTTEIKPRWRRSAWPLSTPGKQTHVHNVDNYHFIKICEDSVM